LAFSPDGTKLAILCGRNGIRLFDSRTLREIAADAGYTEESWGLAFDRNGRIVSSSRDGKIRLYDPALNPLMTVEAPDGKRPDQVAFSPDGTHIAIGYGRTGAVTVLDGHSLCKLFAHTVDHGSLWAVSWSADGETLFAGGSYGLHPGIAATGDCQAIVRAWTGDAHSVARDLPLTSTDGISGFRPLGNGWLAAATRDPRIVMLDSSGSLAWQAEPGTVDFRDQLKTLLMSSDGARVGFEHRGYGRASGVPARFDLRGRQLELDAGADSALSAARTDGLAVEGWEDTDQPRLASKPLALEPYETSRSIAIAPDANSFILGSEWGLNRFDRSGELDWRIQAPAVVWAVNMTQDGRIALAAFRDGSIRWHRMDEGAELLAVFPHSDRKRWVAWTPLGITRPRQVARS
jgi:WD40 repeat protein